MISAVNFACSNYFGYTKTEILDKNVSTLLPPLFAELHNLWIERFLTNIEMSYLNADRVVLGLTKNGYIFETVLKIRPIQDNQLQLQFVGSFKEQLSYKTIG